MEIDTDQEGMCDSFSVVVLPTRHHHKLNSPKKPELERKDELVICYKLL